MHPLVAKAKELGRRLYASLPWGYRVAGLMLHLASGVTDILGRVAYAAFIKAGVEGMPAVRGEAPNAVQHSNPDKLPSGYGKRFGEKVYAILLKKLRDPELVEEVMSQILIRISSGKVAENLRPGTTLSGAENYVLQLVSRVMQDYFRSEHGREDRGTRRQKIYLDHPVTGNPEFEKEKIDLADPTSFKDLDTMLPKHEIPKLMRDLKRVHERAPGWLEARLDGLTGSDIGEEWGVGKTAVAEWEKRYVPAIKKVLSEYIQAAA